MKLKVACIGAGIAGTNHMIRLEKYMPGCDWTKPEGGTAAATSCSLSTAVLVGSVVWCGWVCAALPTITLSICQD